MFSRGLRRLGTLFMCASVIGAAGFLLTQAQPVFSGLTVHEWGTLTSIAGPDSQAMMWWPLTGAADLPNFVEHFRDARFKSSLEGTIRMETPVIYFYAPREQKVSVTVRLAKGVITEWYPHASRVQPVEMLDDWSLRRSHPDGSITWSTVTLRPNATADFLHEERNSHYYTARQTTSTPLAVQIPGGEQQEKFLFYRGVSMFQPPVAATVLIGKGGNPNGSISVENRAGEPVRAAILFERRGDRIGFDINDGFPEQHLFEGPELNGTLDELCTRLEQILISQGLFANEAQAMVETWKDSWFEEGSRLLYIVPENFVNEVLPLKIEPTPAQTVRVFVGRLELATPATRQAILQAIAFRDHVILAKYGRFLEPLLETMANTPAGRQNARQLRDAIEAARAAEWYLSPAKKK